ncbi:GlmU family protein [Croceiramulus getboli]|nr:GlmU family protein [Flavobacteriaceae bacterium YJPT1-3]
MNYILFDGPHRDALLPFTFTRPVADLRIGLLTLREKWEKHLGSTTSTLTEDYLEAKYPMVELEENVMIHASFVPTPQLVEQVKALQPNQAIRCGEEYVAFYTQQGQETVDFESYTILEYPEEEAITVFNTWDIFAKNGKAIELDFELLTAGRTSEPIPETVHCIQPERIFLEPGAKMEIGVLNATNGPIYLGKDSEVMEGSIIRGPFVLGEHSQVKMGAKIYGPTSAGPYCKLGGEINNSVFFAYSSKGHDGFLGNSVIGEWCNLGADTNTSNLKNNYAEVRLWSYETENFARTGLQFCGLMMGDHSKCGINTMFNTGTVVGVASNIFGSGFPRNFVPSFSWGGHGGFVTHLPKKAYETAKIAMARRDVEFSKDDQAILDRVFEDTKGYRRE